MQDVVAHDVTRQRLVDAQVQVIVADLPVGNDRGFTQHAVVDRPGKTHAQGVDLTVCIIIDRFDGSDGIGCALVTGAGRYQDVGRRVARQVSDTGQVIVQKQVLQVGQVTVERVIEQIYRQRRIDNIEGRRARRWLDSAAGRVLQVHGVEDGQASPQGGNREAVIGRDRLYNIKGVRIIDMSNTIDPHLPTDSEVVILLSRKQGVSASVYYALYRNDAVEEGPVVDILLAAQKVFRESENTGVDDAVGGVIVGQQVVDRRRLSIEGDRLGRCRTLAGTAVEDHVAAVQCNPEGIAAGLGIDCQAAVDRFVRLHNNEEVITSVEHVAVNRCGNTEYDAIRVVNRACTRPLRRRGQRLEGVDRRVENTVAVGIAVDQYTTGIAVHRRPQVSVGVEAVDVFSFDDQLIDLDAGAGISCIDTDHRGHRRFRIVEWRRGR